MHLFRYETSEVGVEDFDAGGRAVAAFRHALRVSRRRLKIRRAPSTGVRKGDAHKNLAVQAILATRIDRLPPAEKELLQTLAVIGKEFALKSVAGGRPCRGVEAEAGASAAGRLHLRAAGSRRRRMHLQARAYPWRWHTACCSSSGAAVCISALPRRSNPSSP